MNKKETMLIISILDECIDTAARPEVMLVLDVLRRTLMEIWQRGSCQYIDVQELLKELDSLPALCQETEQNPVLPMRLCQTMFILCAPEMERGQNLARQCREQAWKVRRFQQWIQDISALLVSYDARLRQEIMGFQTNNLEMLSDTFTHFLTLYKGCLAEAASKKRRARQQEIQKHWETISLEDVANAAIQSRTKMEKTKEKLSEFAAEIAASDVLIPVKELSPHYTDSARWQETLPQGIENET